MVIKVTMCKVYIRTKYIFLLEFQVRVFIDCEWTYLLKDIRSMPPVKTSLIDTALLLDVSYVKSRPEANSLPVYNKQLLGVGWHSIHLRCRWSIHVSTASCPRGHVSRKWCFERWSVYRSNSKKKIIGRFLH